MDYTLYTFRILMVMLTVCLFSCSENENNQAGPDTGMLAFSPTVEDLEDDTPVPTGFANTFFLTGDEINVVIENSNSVTTEIKYYYGADGVFRGEPGYRFSLDNSYITNLTASWPSDAPAEGSFVADQRKLEDHRRADWLVATAETYGIMPTDVPVPLFFQHRNSLLEFELAGQNTDGLVISELLLELEVDNEPVACWAYCGNENGRASIYVREGTRIMSQEGYLIGTIPGESGDRYTIILPQMDITLEAGKNYLVTLTPRGYDMDMYVFIGTFASADGERETGIGVPFHKPSEGENGDYIIRTPVQLITMSYVIRHYTDGSTPDYPAKTYVLTDDFVMTEEYAGLYIPIPSSLFTGEVIFQGQVIDSLTYNGNQILQLFDND